MRTIREETKFARQLLEIGVSSERMDSVLEGFSMVLCRRPDIFPGVPGSNVRRLIIKPLAGMPRMNVWFTYDDTTVSLLEIDVAD